ncbi:MAG TPA: hypothetical protein VMH02_07025, partial [Verrucomicrobiae bacterium]|nr:hypothetical protein [Verrucomicrobiae bacterium]
MPFLRVALLLVAVAALAPASLEPLSAAALGIALLFCGAAAAVSRAPLGARIGVPIVAIAAAVPFALAAYHRDLGFAFRGALGWAGWAAVEVLL